MHNKKYTLLVEDNTMHDGDVLLLDDKQILCVLENERVTKHKHAMYECCDNDVIHYIKDSYGIKDEDLEVVRGISNIPYLTHHELHAAATYFSSGFDKASILVIDGYGDLDDSVTLFASRGKEIYQLKKYGRNYSLGILYSIASNLIYGSSNGEGKLMGLSCCAEPEYNIPSPIQYHEDGTVEVLFDDKAEDFVLDDALIEYITRNFAYLCDNTEKVLKYDVYKAKIAATVQWWFTEQTINLVKYLKKLNPNSENLCVCGGCFLNCETNGIIDRLGLFKNIYCIPAPADNSIILGRAQQVLISRGFEPQQIKSPYLGPNNESSFEELMDIFKVSKTENGLVSNIENIHNVSEYNEDWVIERLKANRVILWFDGSSEFGPRALGHRSFLANPETNEMFIKLSMDIKSRENYRPLAPITTDELYPTIFEDEHPENLTAFMLKTVRVKPEWHRKLKAIVHVNQTARPQRLTKDINPVLYSLITKWNQETGIPCLVNTSLNLKAQPLLETYNDLKSVIATMNIDANKCCSVVVDHKLCFDIH